MRLLIVKLGSIGDIVHTLPVFEAMRRALPDAHVSWAVEEKSAENADDRQY
jgi:heptosyltransferase I